MKPSPTCLDLIRQSEGCQFKAYRCPAGVLTIGYGHTGPDVREGQVINWTQAEQLLERDVASAADSVNRLALPCTQGQFDAFVDFVFNFGATKFSGSSLLHLHKAQQFTRAAAEFGKWVHGDGGHVLPGLIRRRAAEAHLYLSGDLPTDVKVSQEEGDGA